LLLFVAHSTNNAICRSVRPWALGLLAIGLGLAIPSGKAFAGSKSALVTVSVQVVESCRVEANDNPSGAATDVSMRCNSKARPSLMLANSSLSVAPIDEVSVPRSALADTPNGKALTIEF
jgi:hypothetical protein